MDLTNDKAIAALYGLFFIIFVWAAIAGWHVGTIAAKALNDIPSGVGIGFLAFASLIIGDFMYLLWIEDVRNRQKLTVSKQAESSI